MKNILVVLLGAILWAVPAQAVLKERDLGKTLSILRSELTNSHNEQSKQLSKFKEQRDMVRNKLFSILSSSNQNALMLYSQKPDYVFDLTYACHEATEQFRDFKKSALPFRSFVDKQDAEIARYDSLIVALKHMPTVNMTEQEKIDRNVCLTFAINIRRSIEDQKTALNEYMRYYDLTENRLKTLNDYANKRYNEIQNNIFINGGESYFNILSQFGSYVTRMAETVNEKYQPSRRTKSQWDSRMIIGLFVVILFYGIISVTLSFVGIRFLLPKKFRTEAFMVKRPCIIMAATSVTFALVLGIIKNTINQNFISMASDLLVEYAWLLSVILLSLLLRVDGRRIKSAFRIYTPLVTVGFLVIAFRIILIPNDLVNLVFPPILLACTVWQWMVIGKHNDNIPRSDVFYTYISLVVFIASLVCSWTGYTLLSVQMLIWWVMQLTCILTISCMAAWMNKYAEKHHIDERPITKTWIYLFIYKVVLPLMSVGSILLSVYWASDVFNLSDITKSIFTKRFIDADNFSMSILSTVMVVSLWFIFAYIAKVSIALMKYHFEQNAIQNSASRTVMGRNVIQVLVWGLWFIISLSIMHVSNTWIVVISGGLSTGVGFASKDIIENIYYGISLMAGRIKIGDWIECDGIRGKVSSISYTSTLIEANDGSVIAFQNSQLFTKNYKNLTRNHGYELSKVCFGVAYGSNIKQVGELVVQAVGALKCPYIDREKALTTIVTELGDNSVNMKFLCWVDVTKQALVESQILSCIYDTLNEHNIEIPFPQRDIHIKNG